MNALEAAAEMLAGMTRAEKAQVLQWAARDLGDAFPGIESRPGICGGEPCIVRTRIPVWILEQARRLDQQIRSPRQRESAAAPERRSTPPSSRVSQQE